MPPPLPQPLPSPQPTPQAVLRLTPLPQSSPQPTPPAANEHGNAKLVFQLTNLSVDALNEQAVRSLLEAATQQAIAVALARVAAVGPATMTESTDPIIIEMSFTPKAALSIDEALQETMAMKIRLCQDVASAAITVEGVAEVASGSIGVTLLAARGGEADPLAADVRQSLDNARAGTQRCVPTLLALVSIFLLRQSM